MKLYFREDDTLVICAENSVESMALKYWLNEYKAHGEKVLDIETEPPIQLGDNSR